MLRPSQGSILGSTLAERRRNLRRERVRAVWSALRGAGLLSAGLVAALFLLVLPLVLPVLYLCSAFVALALPLRWLTGASRPSPIAVAEWIGALALTALGGVRAAQRVEPAAPVTREFARGLLFAGWALAALLAAADLAR